MQNEEPDINPEAVYNVKETAAILGIHRDTLDDRRKKGRINPVNPNVSKGFKYKGDAIRRFWRLENYLPV